MTGSDVDEILMVGDRVYTASFAVAIVKMPRNLTYMTATEVKEKILLNISRLNNLVKQLQCNALHQQEIPGIFELNGLRRLTVFFSTHMYGVLISCLL